MSRRALARRDPLVTATSGILAAAGVLHVAWGLGLSLPGLDPKVVADAVAGSERLPSASACLAVGTGLGAAALLVAGVPARAPRLLRAGQTTVAIALGTRGLLGLMRRTDLVAPGAI